MVANEEGAREMAKGEGRDSARHWDAGDAGCGAFIVRLKREVNEVAPGSTLSVTTENAGAPVDVPAWCRMSGHTLVFADHPLYVIRKRLF